MFYVIGMLWKELFIIFLLGLLHPFCLPAYPFPLENRLRNISTCARMYLHRVGSGIHSFGKYLLSNSGPCQTLFPAESKSNKAKICLQEVHNMNGEMVKGEKDYNR